MSIEQIGLWAGFVLTLMVFSYLLGDNFLYRLAVYVFVGLAAGFVTIVTLESVILPWLNATMFSSDGGLGGIVIGALPLLLAGLLLLKTLSPRLGRLGSIALAFVIGVGAAVAVTGAIFGTLLPLAAATAAPRPAAVPHGGIVNTLLIFAGVACTLVYFQYLSRRSPLTGRVRRNLLVRSMSVVGEGVLVITLGALYGGAILASLTIFTERIGFLLARVAGGG